MTTRQDFGCVFEDDVRKVDRRSYVLHRDGKPMAPFAPSKCPSWLARQPLLDEAQAALPHWKHGTLPAWLGVPAEDLPDELLGTLSALESAANEYAADPNRPRRKD